MLQLLRLYAINVNADAMLERRQELEMGETARGALEWLCSVHEQSRKCRPMTVRPPLLRLCIPSTAVVTMAAAAVAPMQEG